MLIPVESKPPLSVKSRACILSHCRLMNDALASLMVCSTSLLLAEVPKLHDYAWWTAIGWSAGQLDCSLSSSACWPCFSIRFVDALILKFTLHTLIR